MKTLFVWFFIEITSILCYAQEINYSNTETFKPIMYNTDTNINSKTPEFIAKYIISRNNNTQYIENPKISLWNKILGDNMKNSRNIQELGSNNNVITKEMNVVKPVPYKYIEVIHYVPVKVTTSKLGQKIILDTNANLQNNQKIISKLDMNDMQNTVVNDNLNNNRNFLMNVKDLNETANVNEYNVNDMKDFILKNDNFGNLQSNIANNHHVIYNIRKSLLNKNNINSVSSNKLYKIQEHSISDHSNDKQNIIEDKNNLDKNDLNNGEKDIISQDDSSHRQKNILYTDNTSRIQTMVANNNEMQEIASKNSFKNISNLQVVNVEQNSDEIINNDNKESLLSSFGYIVNHPPDDDDTVTKIKFKVILHYFIKFLEEKGISDLDILKYLRQGQVSNTGSEILSERTDFKHSGEVLDTENLKNDTTIKKIEQQALLNSLRHLIHNTVKGEDQFTHKPKEINMLMLIIRDFRKYLVEKGVTDSEVLVYLQQVLREVINEGVKEISLQSSTNNQTTDSKMNDQAEKDAAFNKNLNTSYSTLSEHEMNSSLENQQSREEFNSNSTISIKDLVDSKEHEVKSNIDNTEIPNISTEIAETNNSLNVLGNNENTSIDTTEKMDDKELNYINDQELSQNLHEKIPLKENTTVESQTLPPIVITTLPLLTITEEMRKNNLDLNEDVETRNLMRGNDNNIKIDKDVVIDNITDIEKEKIMNNNETSKYENVALEVGVNTNGQPERYETIIVPFSTESILYTPMELENDTNTDNKEKQDEDKNNYLMKDNFDVIDLWTSEKPNLAYIFDIKSPKLGDFHNNNNNNEHINNEQTNYKTELVINHIINIKKAITELEIVLKTELQKLNPKYINLYINIFNQLASELSNRQTNLASELKLGTNDNVIQKLTFLNTILPLLKNAPCRNDDLLKIILKYVLIYLIC